MHYSPFRTASIKTRRFIDLKKETYHEHEVPCEDKEYCIVIQHFDHVRQILFYLTMLFLLLFVIVTTIVAVIAIIAVHLLLLSVDEYFYDLQKSW